MSICDDLLVNIWSWCECYNDCEYVIAGDFNANLDGSDPVAIIRLANLVNDCRFARCDDLVPSQKVDTYVNIPLNYSSHIDYILVSATNDVYQLYCSRS